MKDRISKTKLSKVSHQKLPELNRGKHRVSKQYCFGDIRNKLGVFSFSIPQVRTLRRRLGLRDFLLLSKQIIGNEFPKTASDELLNVVLNVQECDATIA